MSFYTKASSSGSGSGRSKFKGIAPAIFFSVENFLPRAEIEYYLELEADYLVQKVREQCRRTRKYLENPCFPTFFQ